MSDIHSPDPNSDFARSLIDAGKNEPAPVGGTAHILDQVAGASTVTASATASGFLAKSAWAAAVVAIGAATGAVGLANHPPTTHATVVAEPPLTAVAAITPTPITASPSVPQVLARGPATRAPTACERVDLPDNAPTVCSTPGRREELEMVNSCADDVDVFWVDFKCRETFVARVTPGQQFGQITYDTHPWRVRDHATHRLIKEWVGPKRPEPPKDPVELPDVVIRDDSSLSESAPTLCSHSSDTAKLRFVNQRTSGVSIVFWVDYDCQEKVENRMEPGETWTAQTFDAHPFRVRDENGKLLVDYLPDGADQKLYVSLP